MCSKLDGKWICVHCIDRLKKETKNGVAGRDRVDQKSSGNEGTRDAGKAKET